MSGMSGSGGVSPVTQIQSVLSSNPLQALAVSQSIYQLDGLQRSVALSLYDLTEFKSSTVTREGGDGSVAELIVAYEVLLGDIQRYKALAVSLDVTSINTKIIDFRSRLSKLDDRKEPFMAVGGKNGFVATARAASHYFMVSILHVIGPMFAIMLITNATIGKHTETSFVNWTFKIFYAFWALLWYPALLLYGCFNPPVISAFFPIYKSEDLTYLTYFIAYNPPSIEVDGAEWNKWITWTTSLVLFVLFLYEFIYYTYG